MGDHFDEYQRPWLAVMSREEFERLANYNGRCHGWRSEDPSEMFRLQRAYDRVMGHKKRWVDDRLPNEPWRLDGEIWRRVVKVSKGPGGHGGTWWKKGLRTVHISTSEKWCQDEKCAMRGQHLAGGTTCIDNNGMSLSGSSEQP
jgi:hypothetical protein